MIKGKNKELEYYVEYCSSFLVHIHKTVLAGLHVIYLYSSFILDAAEQQVSTNRA